QRAAQAHVTNSACVIQGAGTAGELAAFGPVTSKERYFSGRRHVLLAPNPVLHFAPTSILPRLLGALLLLCVAGMGQAQAQDNRVVRRVVLDRDTVVLDTLSVVPGYFSLWSDSMEVPPDRYVLEPYKGLLIRMPGAPLDTLTARFRVMPLLLGGTFRHKDPDLLLKPSGDRPDPFKYVPSK